QFPIILFGKSFYQPLMHTIDKMLDEKTISASDLELLLFTDSVDEAMAHIQKYIRSNYRIKPRQRRWWLFERR
ncbi:MAG: LOG family protein, partial [Sphingomonadales bacterium]